MAIIEVIAMKLFSCTLSTWMVTPAVAIIKMATEGTTRRQTNGIISRETSVTARIVGTRSGAKAHQARREKKAKAAITNVRILSPINGYLLSVFLRVLNNSTATL
jgi:hypothetical protein